jgi:hypothetical protein
MGHGQLSTESAAGLALPGSQRLHVAISQPSKGRRGDVSHSYRGSITKVLQLINMCSILQSIVSRLKRFLRRQEKRPRRVCFLGASETITIVHHHSVLSTVTIA